MLSKSEILKKEANNVIYRTERYVLQKARKKLDSDACKRLFNYGTKFVSTWKIRHLIAVFIFFKMMTAFLSFLQNVGDAEDGASIFDSHTSNHNYSVFSEEFINEIESDLHILRDMTDSKDIKNEELMSHMSTMVVERMKASCHCTSPECSSVYSAFPNLQISEQRNRYRPNCNFLLSPLINSVIEVANNSNTSVVVVSGADLSFKSNVLEIVENIYLQFGHFILLGKSCSTEHGTSLSHRIRRKYEKLCPFRQLCERFEHEVSDTFVWVWSTKGPPLFDQPMPPFSFGYGSYETWMMEHVSPFRKLIVANNSCLFSRSPVNIKKAEKQAVHFKRLHNDDWNELNFQRNINMLLEKITSSSESNEALKTSRTDVNVRGNYLISEVTGKGSNESRRQFRSEMRNCEGLCNFSLSINNQRYFRRGVENILKDAIVRFNRSSVVKFPEIVLKVSHNHSVIVTGLNYGHRAMMMNWVCNMRMLGISNFLVIAFDEMLYLFALLQGFPCYLESSFLNQDKIEKTSAVYGTDEFKLFTKLKSKAVYRLLQHGFDVLWSDSDVVMFKNPLHYMSSFHTDIVIQSNAPDDDEPNGIRRINSGFYFVRSNTKSIRVFAELIRFCAASPTTEQGCFYDIMCGIQGQYRVGHNKCIYDGFSLLLLDRSIFPNGLTKGIWNSTPGKILMNWPHLYILHNNWVRGPAKTKRLTRHGLYFFNFENELCQTLQHRQV